MKSYFIIINTIISYVYSLQLLFDTYQCNVIGGAMVMREEGETAGRGGGVDARSVQGVSPRLLYKIFNL